MDGAASRGGGGGGGPLEAAMDGAASRGGGSVCHLTTFNNMKLLS